MKKIMLVMVFLLFGLGTSHQIRSQVLQEEPPITKENLYEQIKKLGIKFPDVVFAQAVLETGHFTSKLFQQGNNLFGMKVPSKRETLSIGKRKGGYAIFDSWESSVNDYLLWQDYVLRNKNIKTKKQYLALLDRIYAKNENYVVHLHRVMAKHQHIFN